MRVQWAKFRRLVDDMCQRLLANPVIEDYTFDMQAAGAGDI